VGLEAPSPAGRAQRPLTTREIRAEIHRRSAANFAKEQRELEQREASFRVERVRGTLPPPTVRWVRGEVERNLDTVKDHGGRIAMPYRAIDTLELLERRHTINHAMHRAGDHFHKLFVTAGLDAMRSPSMIRVAGGGRAPQITNRQVEARDEIWYSLTVLGGHTSPAGLCVWYVIGLEHTIQEWATRNGWGGRPINRTAATGILVAALGVLQAIYKIDEKG